MKKRFLPVLLAAAVVLNLAACGQKQASGTTAAQTFAPPTEAAKAAEQPYVEEHPAQNVLDPAKPIPADTGTLELTEQKFEEENLIL